VATCSDAKVTADDVAQAFLHHALALKTTRTSPPSTAATSPRRCAEARPGRPFGPCGPATLAIASKNYGRSRCELVAVQMAPSILLRSKLPPTILPLARNCFSFRVIPRALPDRQPG